MVLAKKGEEISRLWNDAKVMEDEVIELIAQLEILQTKIRIKEQRLMEMNIVKEIELAQEKEIEVLLIKNSNFLYRLLTYTSLAPSFTLSPVMVDFMAYVWISASVCLSFFLKEKTKTKRKTSHISYTLFRGHNNIWEANH